MILYILHVTPAEALLGEAVTLTLECEASTDTADAFTFEHGSLTIELAREGSGREASYAFPNRRVLHVNGLHVRESPVGGVANITAGETWRRTFDACALFPLQLLTAGTFRWRYTLGASQQVQARAALTIHAGPRSVVTLLDRLEREPLAIVRERVTALLRRMTGRGLDYDPSGDTATRADALEHWRTFWITTGQHLPWDDNAGAIRWPLTPIGALGPEILDALKEWQREPSLEALRGNERVADIRDNWPQGTSRLVADRALLAALGATIDALATGAEQGEAREPEALVVLHTVAEMPAASLLDSLVRLAESARNAGWTRAATAAQGLVEVIAPPAEP